MDILCMDYRLEWMMDSGYGARFIRVKVYFS
jgi:hypothetical protein